jgi:hypothetical protein
MAPLAANQIVAPAIVTGGAYLAGRLGYQVVAPMSAFMISSIGNAVSFQTDQRSKSILSACGVVPVGVLLGRAIVSWKQKVPAHEVLSGRGVLIISGVIIACRLALHHFFKSRDRSRGSQLSQSFIAQWEQGLLQQRQAQQKRTQASS